MKEENIKPVIESIQNAMEGWDYEIIFADDGSTDNTVLNIKKFSDSKIKAVIFNKNYGQTTAMAGGINEATGDYIVTLDGDLQNDPTDIPEMIKKLEDDDLDVIAGVRAKRKDGVFFRKIPSKIANAVIRKFTGVYLHDYGCTLKVFKKDIAKNLGLYGELHRFIPVLAKLQGAKLDEMPVKHHARIHGKSKYGLGRIFKVISDLILMIFFSKILTKTNASFWHNWNLSFLFGDCNKYLSIDCKIYG